MTFNRVVNAASKPPGGGLNVVGLPRKLWPSGDLYFGTHGYEGNGLADATTDINNSTVVVVHNNFIVGYAAKKDRFIKYGLWMAQMRLTTRRVDSRAAR